MPVHEHDKIYIDGAWVPSQGSGTIDVYDSSNGEVFGRIPDGNAADVDAAVKAARAAFPEWAAKSPEERGKFCSRIAEGLGARMDEIATVVTREAGHAEVAEPHGAGGPADQLLQHRRRAGRELRVRDDARHQPRGEGARGRRRLHHAVELPAPPDRRQGGLRHGGGLHRRPEAERGGPARRVHPRRGDRRRRPARWRVQPRHRHRRRGRRSHLAAPRRRHGVLHRLHPRRQGRGRGGVRVPQAGRPRAGWQVRQHPPRRPRRRRLRERRARRRGQGLPQLRADLHRAHPHARAGRQARRRGADRRRRGGDEVPAEGSLRRLRHARTAVEPGPGRPRQRLHPEGHRRGRQARRSVAPASPRAWRTATS